MKNQTLAIIVIVLAATITTSCDNNDNCFHDLASLETEPITTDTIVLFDPKTYAETCYLKHFYMSSDIPADSTFNIIEKVVELVKTDACYQLLSVKEKITDCN